MDKLCDRAYYISNKTLRKSNTFLKAKLFRLNEHPHNEVFKLENEHLKKKVEELSLSF